MESQIENTSLSRSNWLLPLLEIFSVFLPTFLLVKFTSSWVGEDPTRSFVIVWVAYAIMLTLIWTGMKLRGKSWSSIGLTFKPVTFNKGLKIFGLSLVVFIAGVTAFLIAPVVAAIFWEVPEAADFTRYDFLKGNFGGLILMLLGVYIVSSFGEEVIFRAFLIDRISEITGSTKYYKVIAVLMSSIIFGMVHYEWGLMGMIQTAFMGLAMGISYFMLNKRLWILILAHIYMDTLLLVQIYIASN